MGIKIIDILEAKNAAFQGLIPNDEMLGVADGFKDEDDMASDSAIAFCSQQSIKKYVDDNAGGGGGFWADGVDAGEIFYSGGNVGIGTDNPSAPFHVLSDSSSGMIFETTAVGGSALVALTNDDATWQMKINGGADDDFQIVSGATTRLSIDTTGNVNILNGTLDMNTHKILNVVDPTSDQDAATKKYVDEALGADVTVIKTTFDITANTSVIAAAGAGIKNKVVAVMVHNNDADAGDDEVMEITDGDAGTNLIGGATGSAYLVGRGGNYMLPMSAAHPWFESTANTAIFINPKNSKRLSGAIWHIEEA